MSGERVSFSHTADGFRHVRCYRRRFVVNVKGRWFGRALLEVLVAELPNAAPGAAGGAAEYYAAAIADGRILLNGERAESAAVLKDGDVLLHMVRGWHEPPVPSSAIGVVPSPGVEGLVVLDKPAGLPTHATRSHLHNTLLGILAAERPELGELRPLHRLDKLTSGLLLCADSKGAASTLRAAIDGGGGSSKVYLARVRGCLREALDVDAPIVRVDHKGVAVAAAEGADAAAGERESAIAFAAGQAGAQAQKGAPRGAMAAHSSIEPVWHSEQHDCSLVRCVLSSTGRTNQLRLHLHSIGHPIINDPLFPEEREPEKQQPASAPAPAPTGASAGAAAAGAATACEVCGAAGNSDPVGFCHEIYLRCVEFRCAQFSFEVEHPAWAVL